jgi:exonuclease SbcD
MPEQVRIVHAADIHLDSRLHGLGRLGRDDVVGELRLATRRAFDALVDHCLATVPDALVIAGDLYDGDWTDYATGVHFTERMRDLHDAGVPVVLVRGNHDAESVISRSLQLPPTVHQLATDTPESVELGGLVVHGQGFAKPAVTANLALAYPAPRSGMVNVGLLHTSVQGYDGHDPYAPCTLTDLQGRGYEYFALGHVHQRQVLAGGEHTVAFSGNLQGRHPRETGPKGALEVVLTPRGEAQVSFVPFDVARWERLEVDVTDAADRAEALALVDSAVAAASDAAEGRPVVAKVVLVGESRLAGELADRERLGHEVRPAAARHEVVVDTVRSDVVVPAERRRMPAAQRDVLAQVVSDVLADPAALRRDPVLARDLDQLTSELNQDFLRGAGLDLTDDARFAEIVAEAAQRLLARADAGVL